jgi:hypothetical protein
MSEVNITEIIRLWASVRATALYVTAARAYVR